MNKNEATKHLIIINGHQMGKFIRRAGRDIQNLMWLAFVALSIQSPSMSTVQSNNLSLAMICGRFYNLLIALWLLDNSEPATAQS